MTIRQDIIGKIGTLSPINVATQGLFVRVSGRCPLAIAAVRGRLICLAGPLVDAPGVDGALFSGHSPDQGAPPHVLAQRRLKERLLVEDEEILAIIVSLAVVVIDNE